MTGAEYAGLVASYVSRRFGARDLKVGASPHAAYCLPMAAQTDTTPETKELDHLLATHFGWWDVLVEKKKPV